MTKRKRKGLPPVSVLSPEFKYTDSASTDLRATFARVREEAARKAAAEQAIVDEQATVVRKIAGAK